MVVAQKGNYKNGSDIDITLGYIIRLNIKI